jgi:hypothetical protein
VDAATALAGIVFEAINVLWSHLSEPQMIEFAFAEGAWDLGTFGIGDAIDLGAVIVSSSTVGISLATEIFGDYGLYYYG